MATAYQKELREQLIKYCDKHDINYETYGKYSFAYEGYYKWHDPDMNLSFLEVKKQIDNNIKH